MVRTEQVAATHTLLCRVHCVSRLFRVGRRTALVILPAGVMLPGPQGSRSPRNNEDNAVIWLWSIGREAGGPRGEDSPREQRSNHAASSLGTWQSILIGFLAQIRCLSVWLQAGSGFLKPCKHGTAWPDSESSWGVACAEHVKSRGTWPCHSGAAAVSKLLNGCAFMICNIGLLKGT